MPVVQITSRTVARRGLPAVLLCGFAFYGALASDAEPLPAPEPLHRIEASSQKLELRDADSTLLEFPDWLTHVRSHDPTVIHVTAVKPNCLRVLRRADGQTVLRAFDRKAHEYTIELTLVTSPKNKD